MGVFPALFLDPMQASVDKLVQRVQATQTLQAENVDGP
jgi:NADH:ubiquinone oxidoreductase subunit 4 (subunit M)